VFRYLGCIVIALMAVGLAGAVALVLGGEAADALAGRPVVRLTAFDGVGAVGGDPPRLRAAFEGAGGRMPLEVHWAVVRFPDGRAEWAWVTARGLSAPYGPADLGPGRHRWRIGLPETHPRLDVTASADAWVWPATAPVVWVDAAAVVPSGAGAAEAAEAAGGPPPWAGAVLDPLNALAGRYHVVYLVAVDARGYAAVRRRLTAWGAPAGPAFWVIPERTFGRLKGLHGVWPAVAGAVAARDDLGHEAGRVGVPVERVPAAGEAVTPAARADAWARALQRLTTHEAGGRSKGM
jgi:hypothetical protein